MSANTDEVFRAALGHRVVGMYVEGVREHAGRIIVLVLDDGTGLAFGTGNGSHWTVHADDLALHVRARAQELRDIERELRDVLALTGVRVNEEPHE